MITSHRNLSNQVRGPSSRSKLVCQQCRERHVKCDQQYPCGICERRKEECSYGDNIMFTALEYKFNTGRRPHTWKKRPSPRTIVGFVDETPGVSQLYYIPPENIPWNSLDASTTDPDEDISSPIHHLSDAPVTNEKDAFYLARYADILGPRFDMFDNTSRYFSLILPQIALGNRLVLLSCLAAAARQYSLVADRGHHDALTYYNEALKILRKRLDDNTHEASTFASCLLIAHCEMMESKASDWNLHLKGTGELIMIHKWNWQSEGIAQASFWIYCRMIILASLSSGMPTTVDFRQWVQLESSSGPVEKSLDAWQRKVVYLLGSIHNFWARTRDAQTPESLDYHTAEWKSLGDELSRHQYEAPEVCRPLSVIAADAESPFEAVRYVNGSVSAAWQMLHTAYFILTLAQPCRGNMRRRFLSSAEVTRKALIFARKIVSNSITNRCTIAWANAVQLLIIAGQCLVEEVERRACLKVLEDIQHHTGWDARASVVLLHIAWRRDFADGGENGHSDVGKLLYHVWLGNKSTQQEDILP